MELKQQISNWIDGRRDEFISDLSRLIAVPSVRGEAAPGAPFGEGPAKALELALEICESYGFKTRNLDNYLGYADMNALPPALDILVHLDVVGPGEGWETDPYTAVIKDDGCIYGRGTDDDKGPAVAALFAMRCVKALGLPLRSNARLILGTDEESGFSDLDYYFAREKSAPHTFSPDAEFPVYNTEKGSYKPAFSQKWPASEATPRVALFDGGFRINVLPAQASALVLGLGAEEISALCEKEAERLGVQLEVVATDEGVRLAVTGRGSHASDPQSGNNGITALVRLLGLLPLADCGATRALRALAELFPHGDGEGKALGAAMSDELSGPLTVAFSLMSMSDTGISCRFDARVPICANDENCRAVVEKALSDKGFAVTGEMSPPHHTPADSPFVKTLLRSYEAYTGETGGCLSMGGGTYVHGIEGGVAFGASMPDFISNLHGANERASVEALLTAAKIYALAIAELCC